MLPTSNHDVLENGSMHIGNPGMCPGCPLATRYRLKATTSSGERRFTRDPVRHNEIETMLFRADGVLLLHALHVADSSPATTGFF